MFDSGFASFDRPDSGASNNSQADETCTDNCASEDEVTDSTPCSSNFPQSALREAAVACREKNWQDFGMLHICVKSLFMLCLMYSKKPWTTFTEICLSPMA